MDKNKFTLKSAGTLMLTLVPLVWGYVIYVAMRYPMSQSILNKTYFVPELCFILLWYWIGRQYAKLNFEPIISLLLGNALNLVFYLLYSNSWSTLRGLYHAPFGRVIGNLYCWIWHHFISETVYIGPYFALQALIFAFIFSLGYSHAQRPQSKQQIWELRTAAIVPGLITWVLTSMLNLLPPSTFGIPLVIYIVAVMLFIGNRFPRITRSVGKKDEKTI